MSWQIDAASESKAGSHALPSGEEKTVGKLRFAGDGRKRKSPLTAQPQKIGGENLNKGEPQSNCSLANFRRRVLTPAASNRTVTFVSVAVCSKAVTVPTPKRL